VKRNTPADYPRQKIESDHKRAEQAQKEFDRVLAKKGRLSDLVERLK
jgi:hypothetical protein